MSTKVILVYIFFLEFDNLVNLSSLSSTTSTIVAGATSGTITLNPTDLRMGTFRMIAGNVIRTPKYLLNSLYQYEYQSNWLAQQGRIPLIAIVIANSKL